MMQQMKLDLFTVEDERTPEQKAFDDIYGWLVKHNGCDERCQPMLRRLIEERGAIMAHELAKCLPLVYGKRRVDGYTDNDLVDKIGIFDKELDYHVCWDRHWAACNGVPWYKVGDVWRWVYLGGNEPNGYAIYGSSVCHYTDEAMHEAKAICMEALEHHMCDQCQYIRHRMEDGRDCVEYRAYDIFRRADDEA